MFSGTIAAGGTWTSGTRTPSAFDDVVWIVSPSQTRSQQPLRRCLDELRVFMMHPLAPVAILVAEIRDRLRCVRAVLLELPRSTWLPAVRRGARPRDIHHGDALLNFHRMPA